MEKMVDDHSSGLSVGVSVEHILTAPFTHRYATMPIASNCTAGGPSTCVKPVTASSTTLCTMTDMFALTCPRKVSPETRPGL